MKNCLARLLLGGLLVLGCGVEQPDFIWPDNRLSENEHFIVSLNPRGNGAQVGLNLYELEVQDPQRERVSGASIRLELWMPDHGHGSDRTPVVRSDEAGGYIVENVVFTMPGRWSWTVLIETRSNTDVIEWGIDVI